MIVPTLAKTRTGSNWMKS